jgi:hypothetical protein
LISIEPGGRSYRLGGSARGRIALGNHNPLPDWLAPGSSDGRQQASGRRVSSWLPDFCSSVLTSARPGHE